MPVRINKRRIARGIYLLRFRTQYDLTSTFLRVQEHYESPKFHGRAFTLQQYIDWYAPEHGGKFSYYEDWSGFNVPSTAFRFFYDGKFDPLSEKEKQLLRLFKGLHGRFYVIAVFDADKGRSLKHELAHALYFYRRRLSAGRACCDARLQHLSARKQTRPGRLCAACDKGRNTGLYRRTVRRTRRRIQRAQAPAPDAARAVQAAWTQTEAARGQMTRYPVLREEPHQFAQLTIHCTPNLSVSLP